MSDTKPNWNKHHFPAICLDHNGNWWALHNDTKPFYYDSFKGKEITLAAGQAQFMGPSDIAIHYGVDIEDYYEIRPNEKSGEPQPEAKDLVDWVSKSFDCYSLLTERNQHHIYFLLAGLVMNAWHNSENTSNIITLIDTDFPEANDLFKIEGSENVITPFVEFDLEQWSFDEENNRAYLKE